MNHASSRQFKRELSFRQNLPLLMVALVALGLILAGSWLLLAPTEWVPEQEDAKAVEK
jgi:hypothetical protein